MDEQEIGIKLSNQNAWNRDSGDGTVSGDDKVKGMSLGVGG